jgi:hypothetical protein
LGCTLGCTPPPHARLRRPPTLSFEFVRPSCFYSASGAATGQHHSAYLPDHGNLPGDRPHRAGDRPASGLGRLARAPWFLAGVFAEVSEVKRDFACTCTRHVSPVLVVLRSRSRLRPEGRTRTLSGPSPGSEPSQDSCTFRLLEPLAAAIYSGTRRQPPCSLLLLIRSLSQSGG